MYFGLGPFGFALNLQGQQGQQQGHQGQQPRPQQPFFPPGNNPNQNNNNGGIFGGLFDAFMNPFFQPNNQQQQRQQQEEPRPTFFRRSTNEEKQKKQPYNKKEPEILNENHGNFWKKKGNEAYQKGKYEQAILMYSKAIQLNGSQSVYFSNRAQSLKKLNKIEQALKDAQQAIELDSNNARGHILAGQCLAQIGKRDDNLRQLEKAIIRLTKALTLSFGKRIELEKDASRYIYLAKKVIFYIQFNQIRNSRLQALKQYRDYLEKDEKLTNEQKQKKMQQFVSASDQKIIFSIPQYLQCRITFDLMQDPVVTDSGQCYQRFAIEEHMQKNGRTDPFTRQPIKGPLYPCVTIKKAVQEFLERNPWAYQFSEGENYKDIQF